MRAPQEQDRHGQPLAVKSKYVSDWWPIAEAGCTSTVGITDTNQGIIKGPPYNSSVKTCTLN